MMWQSKGLPAAGAAGVFSLGNEWYVCTIHPGIFGTSPSGALLFSVKQRDKLAHTWRAFTCPPKSLDPPPYSPTCLCESLQPAVLIGGLSLWGLIAVLSAPILHCHFVRAFQSDGHANYPSSAHTLVLAHSHGYQRLGCQVQTAAGTKRALWDETGKRLKALCSPMCTHMDTHQYTSSPSRSLLFSPRDPRGDCSS